MDASSRVWVSGKSSTTTRLTGISDFNGPTPEALVQGRERIYFEHYWNDFAADKTHSLPEADRKAYTAAYARPGRMRAGWAYFVSFLQTAKDFAQLSKTKLTIPVRLFS